MAKADRYTLLKTHFNDIPERLQQIKALGLHWLFTRPDIGDTTEVDIFVFFDKAGLDNFLAGKYDSVADAIRRVIKQNENGDLQNDDALQQIKDLLDY